MKARFSYVPNSSHCKRVTEKFCSSVEKNLAIPFVGVNFLHRGTLKVHFRESFPCRLLHNTSTTFTLGRCRLFFVGKVIGVRDWTAGSNDAAVAAAAAN